MATGIDESSALPCPPTASKPIVIVFPGFNETVGGGTHQLGLEIADRLGADLFGPYLQAQNPLAEIGEEAIADVLDFEGQPLDLVKAPLKATIRAGKSTLKTLGFPFVARTEFQRARNELRAALEADPTRPVYVLGYSWGTVSARLLLPKLLRQGATIERVILLDPVHVLHPKISFSPLKILDPLNKRLTVPMELADRTRVIYQRPEPDNGNQGDPFIHGAPVNGVNPENQRNVAVELGAAHPNCAGALVACLHKEVPTDPTVTDDVLGQLPSCCGNDLREGIEHCDGTDDDACPMECVPPGFFGECTCPACGHDLCERGGPLDPATCPSCVAAICAVDPYCCSVYWDWICVSEVESVCALTDCPVCGDGALEEPVEQCEPTNAPSCPDRCLPPGQPDECTCGRCGDGYTHPAFEECDDGNNLSGDGCSSTCTNECLHTKCETGHPLHPNCDNTDNCVARVCAIDPFCCEVAWDGRCIFEIFPECGPTECPYCGDGFLHAPPEQCEGEDLGGHTCQTVGFDEGILECRTSNCTFDGSRCCNDSIDDFFADQSNWCGCYGSRRLSITYQPGLDRYDASFEAPDEFTVLGSKAIDGDVVFDAECRTATLVGDGISLSLDRSGTVPSPLTGTIVTDARVDTCPGESICWELGSDVFRCCATDALGNVTCGSTPCVITTPDVLIDVTEGYVYRTHCPASCYEQTATATAAPSATATPTPETPPEPTPAATATAVCRNNEKETGEECDGTDDAACPGACFNSFLPFERCTCCGDGLLCTKDEFVPGIGCTHRLTDSACADDLNDPDCLASRCLPGNASADFKGCVPGVDSEPEGSPCDDGNPCTTGDACRFLSPEQFLATCVGTPIPGCP